MKRLKLSVAKSLRDKALRIIMSTNLTTNEHKYVNEIYVASDNLVRSMIVKIELSGRRKR